jgi:hypothetical protein
MSNREHRFDLCCKPIGGVDRLNVILEHDMMHRVLELEPREPAAMRLRPSRPPVMQPGRNRSSGAAGGAARCPHRVRWIFYSEPLPAARNPLILLRRVWNLTLT